MSGGVDSGCCAYLLQKDGFSVIGFTLKMSEYGSSEGARLLCEQMGIEHYSVNVFDSFREKVMGDFTSSYLCGETPNPCVRCNKTVKFPETFSFADKMGVNYCATGHYARIEKCGDSFVLKKASDLTKDQSYVLWNLSEDMLSRLRFPLGEYTKIQIREIARDAGLLCADTSDSQDICFIPDGDYTSFIEKNCHLYPQPGSYISSSGAVLGTHRGHHTVTLGQSRGLGVALGKRVYVTGKNPTENTVTLGDESELFRKKVVARDINILCRGALEVRERLSAKIRYGRRENSGFVERIGEDVIEFTFDEAVRAPSPGQSLVIYDGDTVVGGGIITETE